MINPFIQLTSTRGRKVQINVHNINHIEDQTYENSTTRITYISLNSHATTSIHVRENYDIVSAKIKKVFEGKK